MSQNSNLKPGYFLHKLDANFLTKKQFFLFYMPVPMSAYDKFKKEFESKKWTVDFNTGMLEYSKAFGFGWLGLANKDYGDKLIQEEFIAYKIVGEYRQLMPAYKKLMRDYPQAKNCMNLYLTDPNVTKMEENITYILFQV